MRLRLLLNIGDDDVRRLDLEKRFEGETVDVKQAVADELLRRRWATDAVEVQQAPKPAAAAAQLPDLSLMTKAELQAYADDKKIDGVNMGMTKDEMISAVEDAATRPR
jgi:hypothetical protein